MTRDANPFQTGDGFGHWMQDRTGKLTGSRMGAAMSFLKAKKDEKPKESSERRKLKIEILAERLTGNIVPKYVTNEMQWGIDHEPAAKQAFTDHMGAGFDVTDLGFVDHPNIENCGVSPDGYLQAQGALIEVKCPSTGTMLNWQLAATDPDWLPEEYIPQMVLQSACMGGVPVYFCAYDPRLPERVRLIVRKFQPTAEQITEVEEAAKVFLEEVDAMFDQLTRGA
jgi:hypothetical protein